MNSVYSCKQPKIVRKSTSLENHLVEAYPYRGRCSKNNVCFRENHIWACDTGLCKGGKATGEVESDCRSCEPLEQDLINGICQERLITGKVIHQNKSRNRLRNNLKKH